MPKSFEDPFENPESNPKASSTSADSYGLKNASLGKRLVNVIVDGMVISGIGSLLFISSSSFLLANLIYFAYYIYLENNNGQTLGKMLTGTKVLTHDGQKPELSMIIIRTLIRLVPIEWISFFFADDNTGWHDRWTKTRVVEI